MLLTGYIIGRRDSENFVRHKTTAAMRFTGEKRPKHLGPSIYHTGKVPIEMAKSRNHIDTPGSSSDNFLKKTEISCY